MLFSGGYNSADQASARFNNLIGLGESAIGKDMTGKTPATICAHAIVWHRQICPLPEYDEYVSWDDAAGEIAALSPGGQNVQVVHALMAISFSKYQHGVPYRCVRRRGISFG